MSDSRLTNRLLLAILAVLLVQTYLLVERSVQADTLRLDYCITERLDQTPQQYVHVISHSPTASKSSER